MTQASALDPLNRCYDKLIALCDDLELVADCLPDRAPPALCQRLSCEVVSTLMRAHLCEEELLLPLLAGSPRPELRHLAGRLRKEHEFDSGVALEVEELLASLAIGRATLSPDAMGYMLRSFFESMRRHIRSEQDLLVLINDITPSSGHLH
jgi:hypothetical protein